MDRPSKLTRIIEAVDLLHVVKTASTKVPECLRRIADQKYVLVLAYPYYGNQLTELFRDGLHEHFTQHAEEERAQLYQVHKKLIAMGHSGPEPKVSAQEWASVTDTRGALKHLLALEQESVRLWSQLYQATKEMIPLNALAQEYAAECQGHADDLSRYLRSSK